MARIIKRTRTPPVPRGVDIHKKLEWVYTDITDIVPYEQNARDNEKAIPAVAESIKNFGFLIPCVIDKDNVLVAGHTRVEAAKTLGMTEVPCVRAEHLTSEQVTAFRLIDNKVSEIATWDYDLLAGEMSKLEDTGIDFTQFGWTQESLDCLRDVVSDTCLDSAAAVIGETANEGVHERRAPDRVRLVIGEVVTFSSATAYRSWISGLRELMEYNEVAIATEIKRRLGLTE